MHPYILILVQLKEQILVFLVVGSCDITAFFQHSLMANV